jgi:hypothetical protein
MPSMARRSEAPSLRRTAPTPGLVDGELSRWAPPSRRFSTIDSPLVERNGQWPNGLYASVTSVGTPPSSR